MCHSYGPLHHFLVKQRQSVPWWNHTGSRQRLPFFVPGPHAGTAVPEKCLMALQPASGRHILSCWRTSSCKRVSLTHFRVIFWAAAAVCTATWDYLFIQWLIRGHPSVKHFLVLPVPSSGRPFLLMPPKGTTAIKPAKRPCKCVFFAPKLLHVTQPTVPAARFPCLTGDY